MRGVKEYNTNRIEMLDAAELLFITRGYADTTIMDIMNEAHMTKNIFYNHFISKEDIMDKVISRIIDTIVIKAKIIASSYKYTSYQKIYLIMMAQKPSRRNSREIIGERLQICDNSIMCEKILVESIKKLSPILTNVVEEGVKCGELFTMHPEESAEMLITAAQFKLFNEIVGCSEIVLQINIVTFIHKIEKILGIKEENFNDIIIPF